ncbi:hypothetical protein WMY93_026379 [Mugilogobius chulae]|uniref:Uncharacterized protein n=1 Tax=Mugilogobius chulae TaxID=88201 RepID=A0AAW0N8D9_9GOBI
MAGCTAQIFLLLERWQHAEKEHEAAESIWVEKSQSWHLGNEENLDEGAVGTNLPWAESEAAWLESEPAFKSQVEELWRYTEAKVVDGSSQTTDLLEFQRQFYEREKHWATRTTQWLQKEAWFRSLESNSGRIRFLENQVRFLKGENEALVSDRKKLKGEFEDSLKREKVFERDWKEFVVADQSSSDDGERKQQVLRQENAALSLEVDKLKERCLELEKQFEGKLAQKHVELLSQKAECENLSKELVKTQSEMQVLRVKHEEEKDQWIKKENSWLHMERQYLMKQIEHYKKSCEVDTARTSQPEEKVVVPEEEAVQPEAEVVRPKEMPKKKEKIWLDKKMAKLNSELERKRTRSQRRRRRAHKQRQESDASVQREVEKKESCAETEKNTLKLAKDQRGKKKRMHRESKVLEEVQGSKLQQQNGEESQSVKHKKRGVKRQDKAETEVVSVPTISDTPSTPPAPTTPRRSLLARIFRRHE